MPQQNPWLDCVAPVFSQENLTNIAVEKYFILTGDPAMFLFFGPIRCVLVCLTLPTKFELLVRLICSQLRNLVLLAGKDEGSPLKDVHGTRLAIVWSLQCLSSFLPTDNILFAPPSRSGLHSSAKVSSTRRSKAVRSFAGSSFLAF